ncbi:MAG: nucleotidyl transferase AbiEii/AbiGii toxin family protein [Actinomycetes bacterium]
MSRREITNLAASVHRRLLARSHATGAEPNDTFLRYALERFLYRLAVSPHASSFMLKGATLFAVWEEDPHRATRDIDLQGLGEDSAEGLSAVFADVCRVPVPDDGMTFDPASIAVRDIRERQIYQGKRVRLAAKLGAARYTVQIDIGFGDALAAWDTEITMPTVLDFPAPRLRAYPAEAVVAEKLHAMAQHGMLNSRMKDLYDVQALAARLPFEGEGLAEAVRLTFERRSRPMGAELPAPLTPAFATDEVMLRRWAGFLRRNRLEAVELAVAVDRLHAFLLEPWRALASGDKLAKDWPPGGPWQDPAGV